ncbi:hypothetical protein TRAPUB_4242 [Trametes pubescens]|uniref:Uncharacterized protein n=1 Tax=Trametes pubescens TaxID=154538 RepID=A0A1M2VBD3_TRAPU|nr:hypothetical protein TRAPUB_4242 [Trametes pubescens]
MSAKVLSKPEKPHTFSDDMESLLWVVHYCSLLYLPHNLDADSMQCIIHELYDDSVLLRGEMRGGYAKAANRIDRSMTENIEFTNADLQKWLDDVMDLHGPKGLFDEAAERLWKDPENLETLWRSFLATHTLVRDDRIENEFPDPDTYHDRPEGSHVTFVPPPPPVSPVPAKRPVEGEPQVGCGGGARSVKRQRADPSVAESLRRSDRLRSHSGPPAPPPAKRANPKGTAAKQRAATSTNMRTSRRPSTAS